MSVSRSAAPAKGLTGSAPRIVRRRGAHRIAAATGAAVTHCNDVALECVMLADERAARAFVAAELAPLDRGRDGGKLRETLTAYFASGFNASAAAATLQVNDRTIAYRLNSVEEQLGRSVRGRQTELQAAIRLERVLRAPAPSVSDIRVVRASEISDPRRAAAGRLADPSCTELTDLGRPPDPKAEERQCLLPGPLRPTNSTAGR